jgi:predicted transcriptional regulator
MAKYLDADTVLERLKEIGITDSIQTVRRWLREGQLKGKMPEGELRKGKKKSAGYRVDPKDLEAFIQKKREENWLYPELKRLEQENIQLKAEIERLKKQISNAKEGSENEPNQDESEPYALTTKGRDF